MSSRALDSSPALVGGRRIAAATLLVVALGTTVARALAPDGLITEISYLVGLGAAAALAWLGVSCCPPDRRRPWWLITLGVSVSAVADLVWQVLVWVRASEPDVSVADGLWLAAYVLLAAGLVALHPRRRSDDDVDAVIDSLVAATVALLVVWEAALAEIVGDGTLAVAPRVVWSAYPILDIVLLGLVIRAATLGRRGFGPAFVLLALGTVAWFGADLGFLVATGSSAVRSLNVGWMLASLLLAASVVAGRGEVARVDDQGVKTRMWPVMWPLLVPGVLEAWNHVREVERSPLPLVMATAVLLGLATWRGHRLLRAAEGARALVEARERHFRRLTENSSDAVMVLDGEGRVVEGSRNVAALVGIDADLIVGSRIVEAPELEDPDAARALLAKALAAPGTVLAEELSLRHSDGRTVQLAARVVNLLDDPAVAGLVVNLHDVTARHRAEQELAHQAFHDSLTGLANPALFLDRVEQALRRGARSGAHPAVIFLDVDGFKSVNDRFGHAAGDALLREVADRLCAVVRSSDTVARLGGDELAVLVEDHHSHAAEATTTADRILQALSVPVEVGDQLVAVTASIGVALGDASSTAASLLRDADVAMYRAKGAGKARVVLYDAAMATEEGEAARIRSELAGALDRGELVLHYQPVVDLAADRVVGFEALVRWQHPELGLLAPDRFIPVAEETGLVVPLGRWVLAEACATAARWVRESGVDRTMAVNLSARQLASDDIVGDVRRALDAAGFPPHCLVLEMTETALVDDPTAAARRLHRLSDLGVRLAVDDFGTGYSSLSYLRQFPIDILKIDRSFVDTITEGDDLPPIVRGLLDLGRTLDLEIVAEGIERDAQRAGLREARCDLGQGFLFARPLPAQEAERLLRRDAFQQAGSG